MRYDNWDKESLAQKCRELEDENEQLKNKIEKQYTENDHLKFLVDNELEPRIQAEHRAYDGWITSPDRSTT